MRAHCMRAESNHTMSSTLPGDTVALSAPLVSHAASDSDCIRQTTIAGDILYGADEIALYLFGDRKYRRRIYNLVERSVHNLVEGNVFPHFRVGVNICARKSVLLGWISDHEGGNSKGR